MSKITVTSIDTKDSTTDLTIKTGNTSAGQVVFRSNGEIAYSNLTNIKIGSNITINNSTLFVGNASSNVKINSSGITISGSSVGTFANYPQVPGNIYNAKLVASRSSNAETWALKTLAGNDPTPSDPVIWVSYGGDIAQVTSAVSLTISSGSTLGMTNSVASNVWIALVNDSGTFRLAAAVLSDSSGWTTFSPTGFLSATAEGGAGGADTIKTIYSNASITIKKYAWVGYLTYTLATVGTWDTAPSASGFGPNVPKPGTVLQALQMISSTQTSTTSTSYVDTSVKQAITPRSAANIIEVTAGGGAVRNTNDAMKVCISRGTTELVTTTVYVQTSQVIVLPWSRTAIDKPNTTSSTTYVVRIKGDGGTVQFPHVIVEEDGSIIVKELMG